MASFPTPLLPCGLVGSRLFGRSGCEPGMPPGGWFGMRREGLGPPGYRGDMKGCKDKDRDRKEGQRVKELISV